MRLISRIVALGLVLVLVLGPRLAAQGISEYCNFESPQVKPIAVGKVINPNGLSKTVLLVCNTPDSSVEVWNITGGLRDAPSFVTRIPVGLEPVSVVFKRITIDGDTRNMLYTVNWLGDSVTFVDLYLSGNGTTIKHSVAREVRVTDPRGKQDDLNASPTLERGDDEPSHLAIVDRPGNAGQFLVVVKRSTSSYSMLHPFTGEFLDCPRNSGSVDVLHKGGKNVIMTAPPIGDPAINEAFSGNGQVPFGRDMSESPNATRALKEPRAVAWRPGTDEFWVLAERGGGSKLQPPLQRFDFDLWGVRMSPGGAPTFFQQAGLGTTNFNLAFNPAGDHLYVVGMDALNDVQGNGNLLTFENPNPDTTTGFARTLLSQVDLSTPPNLRTVRQRDVNRDTTGAAVHGSTSSLSHVTDVAVYVHPDGTEFVCLAGFNSSRFGIVKITGTDPQAWPINRIGVEADPGDPTGVTPATSPLFKAGPRGLALLETGSATTDRVYLLNRLDQSITVLALNSGPLASDAGVPVFKKQFALNRNAVEPAHIRDGRRFLYSTEFSGDGSAAGFPGHGLKGFVACASCHIDGRTDQLRWKLTAGVAGAMDPEAASVLSPQPTQPLVAVETDNPLQLNSTFPSDNPPLASNANDKGRMVTQSLQGLLNFEVGGNLFDDDSITDDSSNDPFDDLVSNAPYHWRGDKDNFRHFNEAFINLQGTSQAIGSVPEGGLSTGQMKDYVRFINSIHYPPNPLEPKERVYSGEMWTDPDSVPTGTPPPGEATEARLGFKLFHILDLGGLLSGRSCVQCHNLPDGSNNRVTEPAIDVAPNGDFQLIETAALRGLTQKEKVLALNSERTTTGLQTGEHGLAHLGADANRNAFLDLFNVPTDPQLNALTEFVRQYDSGVAPIIGASETFTQSGSSALLDTMEAQAAEANCGISVYARVKVGSTYDLRGYWYKLTAAGGPKYKRVGSTDELGRASLLALLGADSTETGDIMIFRATPLGSDRRLASFAQATSDLPEATITTPANVVIVGTSPNTANDFLVNLTRSFDPGHGFAWTGNQFLVPLSIRLVWKLQTALGISAHHEVPRRVQVTGDNLTYGAKIRLSFPNVVGGASGDRQIEMPIYPTDAILSDGKRVWETAVEFDARALYSMMLGGPGDTAVDRAFRDDPDDPGDPLDDAPVLIEASNIVGGWSTPPAPVPFPYPKATPPPPHGQP